MPEKTEEMDRLHTLQTSLLETNEASKICSLHFRSEDFSRMFTALPGQGKLSAPRFRFPYVVKDAMEKSKEGLSGSDEGELSNNSAKGDNHVEPIRSPPPILPPLRKNLSKAWNSRLVPIRSL